MALTLTSKLTRPTSKISDYQHRHHGIEWKQIHMRSIDGTDLALAVATVSSQASSPKDGDAVQSHVYILFCQGQSTHLPSTQASAFKI